MTTENAICASDMVATANCRYFISSPESLMTTSRESIAQFCAAARKDNVSINIIEIYHTRAELCIALNILERRTPTSFNHGFSEQIGAGSQFRRCKSILQFVHEELHIFKQQPVRKQPASSFNSELFIPFHRRTCLCLTLAIHG